MSENEILDVFGAPDPSKRRPWGLVLPIERIGGNLSMHHDWKTVAWFATKRAAVAYGRKHHTREGFAIANLYSLAGVLV